MCFKIIVIDTSKSAYKRMERHTWITIGMHPKQAIMDVKIPKTLQYYNPQ